MPKPSLELPNIPASTVMELRSEDRLEERHEHMEFASTRYRRLRGAIGCLAYGRQTAARQHALDTGIKIAGVLDQYAVVEPAPEDIVHESLERIARKVQGYEAELSMMRMTVMQRSLIRLSKHAPRTADTFDAIAIRHVDGDLKRLELARQGAAMLRCASYEIDLDATRRRSKVYPLRLKADTQA